jgi:hypothetical protein
MDMLSIATAILAWQREFLEPPALMDDDLRALYAHKRNLQPPRPAPVLGPIRGEIAEGVAHLGAALRLTVRRLAMH